MRTPLELLVSTAVGNGLQQQIPHVLVNQTVIFPSEYYLETCAHAKEV